MGRTLILDTNVLVAGLRSARGASHALLQAIGGEEFTVGLTPALVLEYEDILKRPGMVPLAPEDVDVLLDHICAAGKRCGVRFRLRPTSRDPGDDLVLEAAVATESQWIVTLNARDLQAGARRLGVEVLTPGEALQRLGD